MVLLTATVMYLIIDFFYVCWIFYIKQQFPSYIQEYISRAMYGFTAKMKDILQSNQVMRKIRTMRQSPDVP